MYATFSDMTAMYGAEEILALSQLENSSSTVNYAVIERALDNASSEMDFYLGARGAVIPVTPVPPILTYWCCEIARAILDRNNPREAVTERYKEIKAMLAEYASGKGNIPGLDIPVGESTKQDVRLVSLETGVSDLLGGF